MRLCLIGLISNLVVTRNLPERVEGEEEFIKLVKDENVLASLSQFAEGTVSFLPFVNRYMETVRAVRAVARNMTPKTTDKKWIIVGSSVGVA